MVEERMARSNRQSNRTSPSNKNRSSARKRGLAGQLVLALLRRPGLTLGCLGIGGLATAIAVNALALQPERHHFPLFANKPAPVRAPAAVPAPPPVPLPPRRAEQAAAQQLALTAEIQTELGMRGFYVAPTAGSSGTSLDSAIRDFQEAAGVRIDGQPSEALLARLKASDLTVKDQIARLLMPASAAVAPPSAAQPNVAQANVAKVQRALNKVGYGPLQEDGILGAGTKAAIQRFEKDNGLPVSGEAQGRMLRALASLSGITVE
jgi:hypothetical protein